jgi:hypothetical protein
MTVIPSASISFAKKRNLAKHRQQAKRVVDFFWDRLEPIVVKTISEGIDPRLLRLIGVWTSYQVEHSDGSVKNLPSEERVTYVISPNFDDHRVLEYKAFISNHDEPIEMGKIWFGSDETLCFGNKFKTNQTGRKWRIWREGQKNDRLSVKSRSKERVFEEVFWKEL